MSQVSFTDAQILQQAKGNALGVIIATIAYLKQRGQSIDAWACSVGEQFAPGWAEIKGKGAYEVAVAAALNPVSSGATLISVDGDAQHAVAIVEFPALGQELESFGVSLAELDQFMGGAYVPIARYLGLGYVWQRDGSAGHTNSPHEGARLASQGKRRTTPISRTTSRKNWGRVKHSP